MLVYTADRMTQRTGDTKKTEKYAHDVPAAAIQTGRVNARADFSDDSGITLNIS
jgi:hypothetical protein